MSTIFCDSISTSFNPNLFVSNTKRKPIKHNYLYLLTKNSFLSIDMFGLTTYFKRIIWGVERRKNESHVSESQVKG